MISFKFNNSPIMITPVGAAGSKDGTVFSAWTDETMNSSYIICAQTGYSKNADGKRLTILDQYDNTIYGVTSCSR